MIRIKRNKILFYIIIFFMIIVCCFSYGMSDYDMYHIAYDRIANGIDTGYKMESGYIFCEKIGCLLGMDFITFRAVYLGIALLLLCSSLYEYSKQSCLALSVYIIYPFMLDIVQMRHYMAAAILMYSFRYLREFKKSNVIKYIALVLLASTQHLISFVFFGFLLVFIGDNLKRFVKWILALLALAIVFLYGINREGIFRTIYIWLIDFILKIRTNGYLSIEGINDSVYKHYVVMLILIGSLIFMIYRYYKMELMADEAEKQKFNWLFKISILAVCLIPLIQINDNFGRAFRIVFPLINILFLDFSKQYGNKKLGRYVFLMLPYALAILYFIMFLSSRSLNHYRNVTLPILHNNYFFEFFK